MRVSREASRPVCSIRALDCPWRRAGGSRPCPGAARRGGSDWTRCPGAGCDRGSCGSSAPIRGGRSGRSHAAEHSRIDSHAGRHTATPEGPHRPDKGPLNCCPTVGMAGSEPTASSSRTLGWRVIEVDKDSWSATGNPCSAPAVAVVAALRCRTATGTQQTVTGDSSRPHGRLVSRASKDHGAVLTPCGALAASTTYPSMTRAASANGIWKNSRSLRMR